MRPWATRTAKTALLAAGFAAAAGGLSGVPMSRRNRLAQALFRLELRMCGLGV